MSSLGILPSAPTAVQLVAIPGGEIMLRDDRLKQQWRVEIAPFWLARFPVTQGLYRAVTGESPSSFSGDEHPVESVSWQQAVQFCNQLSRTEGLQPCYEMAAGTETICFAPGANGYRLPTEAEWEYACKAGSTGSRYGELAAIAWYKDNADGQTQPVGRKQPNAWGLHDMLGNVWEWCSDIYDASVYGSYRIMRGGGWSDEPRGCLATNRRRSHPTKFAIDDLGFRVARNLL
ncbi:formylglycine-generating enzyme family protein [Hymenobacter cellulosivorans]|uniref:Formylglycine-generating enzyme family protein n=1 Tax=Hymenobacter cellulosivorans TaxID=2932249 RepID=A0ABY4F470_9BACT|nr:SUMF1/EgtB/PvdO family nonheme iron enzyme [Hymenobacter cellulosivorans]UOQ51345.1 formylglycine-generating enzyme family protein [Hymenobacter cellulosivorans]